MSTIYKKVGFICAAAAAAAVFCAMPISVERSAISGVVLSVDQAKPALAIRPVQLVLQEPIGVIGGRRGAARRALPASFSVSKGCVTRVAAFLHSQDISGSF
jgi:hypothetical protein